MTKFVEAIRPLKYLTEGKIYEVVDEKTMLGGIVFYLIKDDNNKTGWYSYYSFKGVEPPKEETNNFKFIPETEIQYVTVNGVKGILIKEE